MAEKFGPIAAGIVRRESDDRRVVAFPGKEWREERSKLVNSTDPVDFAVSYDPKSLHKEVDRRMDAKKAPATAAEDSGSRLQTFHNSVAKASRFLGLTE
jgi:hypothetical protein